MLGLYWLNVGTCIMLSVPQVFLNYLVKQTKKHYPLTL